MKKEKVLERMLHSKVIPLFYNGDIKVSKDLVDACYEGGARVIEFTNRGSEAATVFTGLLDHCNSNYPDMALGIGSISSVEQASFYIQEGAHFLVSPFIQEDLAKLASERDIFWTGGCGTLTEMQAAYSWGVSLIKLFPGGIYGPAMIKNVKAPCPWLNIMPTGGVKPEQENLEGWFRSGASCVGMGSQLFKKNAESNFDLSEISKKVAFSRSVAEQFA